MTRFTVIASALLGAILVAPASTVGDPGVAGSSTTGVQAPEAIVAGAYVAPDGTIQRGGKSLWDTARADHRRDKR